LLRIDLALPVLRRRIAGLADDTLGEVTEWFLEDEVDLEVEGWQQQVRIRLIDCLKVLEESRCDTAELCLDGRWWIFTGGMSWGDAPSDAYESVVGLSIAGITDEPIGIDELASSDSTSDKKV
jgi:hypothetical protein